MREYDEDDMGKQYYKLSLMAEGESIETPLGQYIKARGSDGADSFHWSGYCWSGSKMGYGSFLFH